MYIHVIYSLNSLLFFFTFPHIFRQKHGFFDIFGHVFPCAFSLLTMTISFKLFEHLLIINFSGSFFSNFQICSANFPMLFVTLQSLKLVGTLHASSNIFLGFFFVVIFNYLPENLDFYILPVIFAFYNLPAVRFGWNFVCTFYLSIRMSGLFFSLFVIFSDKTCEYTCFIKFLDTFLFYALRYLINTKFFVILPTLFVILQRHSLSNNIAYRSLYLYLINITAIKYKALR